MAEKNIVTKDTPPAEIERDIERTRKDMSRTIDEIKERISTQHWVGVVRETISGKVNKAVSRGKELAGRGAESARALGRGARDSSLKAKDRARVFMKDNPSAVSIIGFELGVLAVAAFQRLKQRKARIKKRPYGSEYARARIMPMEEVEQKVKRAAEAPESEFKKAA